MKAILVDDEKWMLEQFEDECNGIEEIDIIGKFSSGSSALEFVKNNSVDIAFLDVQMPGMSGTELAKRLYETTENIIVIYVTASESYISPSDARNSGHCVIMKPYTKDDILKALRLIQEENV